MVRVRVSGGDTIVSLLSCRQSIHLGTVRIWTEEEGAGTVDFLHLTARNSRPDQPSTLQLLTWQLGSPIVFVLAVHARCVNSLGAQSIYLAPSFHLASLFAKHVRTRDKI